MHPADHTWTTRELRRGALRLTRRSGGASRPASVAWRSAGRSQEQITKLDFHLIAINPDPNVCRRPLYQRLTLCAKSGQDAANRD
jgi:hypothetical protein